MIEIHWPLLLAQGATFLVAVLILWKFAWGPLTAFMDARKEEFQKRLDEQHRKKEELDELDKKYTARLTDLRREADEALRRASEEGRMAGQQMLEAAHRDAKKLLDSAQAQIKEEKDKALLEVRRQSVEIAVQIAEKLMREKLDKKMQDKLEQDFFKSWDTGTKN
jgi:F-type H+-transporting ATPase subunit b